MSIQCFKTFPEKSYIFFENVTIENFTNLILMFLVKNAGIKIIS